MLENDCKLEQEIIGWELGRQKHTHFHNKIT